MLESQQPRAQSRVVPGAVAAKQVRRFATCAGDVDAGSPEQSGTPRGLGKLALLLAAVPTGWGTWKLAQSQQWSADYHTAVGQRRN